MKQGLIGCSIGLSIHGHQQCSQSLLLVLVIPGWEWCAASSSFAVSAEGAMNLSAHSRRPSLTESSSLTRRNGTMSCCRLPAGGQRDETHCITCCNVLSFKVSQKINLERNTIGNHTSSFVSFGMHNRLLKRHPRESIGHAIVLSFLEFHCVIVLQRPCVPSCDAKRLLACFLQGFEALKRGPSFLSPERGFSLSKQLVQQLCYLANHGMNRE